MKKIVLILVSLTVIITLGACRLSSGGAGGNTTVPSAEVTTAEAVTQTPQPEATEASELQTTAQESSSKATTAAEKKAVLRKETTEKAAPEEETAAEHKPLPESNITECDNIIFSLTNKARKARDIKVYKWSDELHNLAVIRAKEAAEKWSHTRPDGTFFNTVFDEYGVYYTQLCCENLGYTSGEDMHSLFDALMASREHRKNILNRNVRYCGVGTYVASDGKTYIAMLFSD